MRTHALGVVFLLLLGSLAEGAVAQAKLHVPRGALRVGAAVPILLIDPSHAGQTVLIVVDGGGFPDRVAETLLVQLDASGRGTVQWKVPDWNGVRINAVGADEVVRPIRPAEQ